MKKTLTPELKKLKEEYDFLNKKLGDLQWERATIRYGRIGISRSELDTIDEQIDNYMDNMNILMDKIDDAVRDANAADKSLRIRKPAISKKLPDLQAREKKNEHR